MWPLSKAADGSDSEQAALLGPVYGENIGRGVCSTDTVDAKVTRVGVSGQNAGGKTRGVCFEGQWVEKRTCLGKDCTAG